MSKAKLLTIAGVPACLLLTFAFFYHQEIVDHWHAQQKHGEAVALIKSGQWGPAMQAAHDAEQLNPDSAAYQMTFILARRNFMKELKFRIDSMDAVGGLFALHSAADIFGAAWDDDAEMQIESWRTELEPPALDEVASAFDSNMESLTKIFGEREKGFATFFSTGNQAKARAEMAAWESLSGAASAWAGSNADLLVTCLAKVAPPFQKAVYVDFQTKLQGVKQQIQGRREAAEQLAARNDFLGAKEIFDTLKSHESWVPGLQEARLAMQSAGEQFFTGKIVAANFAGNLPDAGTSLKHLLLLQGQEIGGIDFNHIFNASTTDGFLKMLARFSLHPARPEDRTSFTDVLLVAANASRLADQEAADKFLGEAYLAWARQQAGAGRPGTACYLALLAEKHGCSAAGAIFAQARADITNRFQIELTLGPESDDTDKADKDFSGALYAEAVNVIRDRTPPWIRCDAPENAGSNTVPTVRLLFKAGVNRFASNYQRNVRQVTKEFPVPVTVDNPEYAKAAQAEAQAEGMMSKAQQQYQSDAQAISLAQTAFSMANSSILGSVMNGVVGGAAKGNAQTGVAQAQQSLASAQATLANTPRQIQATQQKPFQWDEIDHITTYHARFKVGVGTETKPAEELAFDGDTQFASTERRAIDQINLRALEREEPDLQKVQSLLLDQLKSQLDDRLKANVSRMIKTAVLKRLANGEPSANSYTQEQLLDVEFLWWATPQQDYLALANPDYLGRFGDVVTPPAAREAEYLLKMK